MGLCVDGSGECGCWWQLRESDMKYELLKQQLHDGERAVAMLKDKLAKVKSDDDEVAFEALSAVGSLCRMYPVGHAAAMGRCVPVPDSQDQAAVG